MLYQYANSGNVTADKSRVVGYAAMGFYKITLTDKEKKELLELAKNTIISHVKGRKTAEFFPDDQRLRANSATFVTIKRNGQLRGCIGNIMPVIPLYQSVITNAVSASSRDPRFPPMTEAELEDMEVELTILSPLEPLGNINEIIVGKHGLYLTNENTSSVFLPQVPVEQQWDLNAYLENLSLKANLPKDAWKTSKLYIFTADIIR
jgi:AmmeMemoRadiSam system protein A